MLSKFLDPKNDIAFKKIFGSEKNKDILIHFLNDMLKFKEKKPITELAFLNTVQDPLIAARKTSVVDIMLCKDELGNSYIVGRWCVNIVTLQQFCCSYKIMSYLTRGN